MNDSCVLRYTTDWISKVTDDDSQYKIDTYTLIRIQHKFELTYKINNTEIIQNNKKNPLEM